jgi:uncharacterized protein YerC
VSVADSEKAKAVRMVRDGATYVAAAQVVGVSMWTVLRWCYRSGVRSVYGKLDRHRERAIVARIKSGEPYAAIGQDYGITRQRVHHIAKRNGVQRTEWPV